MTISPLKPASAPAPADFDDFYRQFFVRVLVLIRRHFPTCDAEDIAQETMTRCFAKFDTLDPGRDPWPWVNSVARNAAIDAMRRTRKTVSTDELPEVVYPGDDTTYDAVVEAEQVTTVRAALHRLRAADRQLLEDHELEGLGYTEMAALRDTTPNALRQRLHRAKGKLATELRRAGASLGTVPVAVQARFERVARRANDFAAAAGPAAASAMGVAAVAGVTTAAAVLGGTGPVVTVAAGPPAQGDVVSSAAHGAPRAAHGGSTGQRNASRGPGSVEEMRPLVPPPPVNTPVRVRRTGDPVNKPNEPSSHDIEIETPLGTIEEHQQMWATPGQGVLCYFGLTECPKPPPEDPEDP